MNKIWTNDDGRATYRFSYDEEDRSFNASFRVDDAEQWSEVVTYFLDFLSGVYGYDIKKFVDYKGNPNNPPVKMEDDINITIFDEDNT